MYYLAIFVVFVFLPLITVHLYQRNNPEYAEFKRYSLSKAGALIAFLLFCFLLLADSIAPYFSYNLDIMGEGRRGIAPYIGLWCFGLIQLSYPHVTRRESWRINPTGLQFSRRYETKWHLGSGLLITSIAIWLTLKLT